MIMHNFREGNKVVCLFVRKASNQSNMNHLLYLEVPPLVDTRMLVDKDEASSLKLVVDDACRMLAELENLNALGDIIVSCNIMEQF